MAAGRIKILPALLLLFLIILQYHLWFDPRGVIRMVRLKRELTVVRAANEKLKLRNDDLRIEVRHLQQNRDAIESEARESLGMIRRGETFYHENITK